MNPLISAEELHLNLTKYKVIDATWFMPSEGKNGHQEYLKEHIPGAHFFDINEVSDKNTDLPHMLPYPEDFAECVSAMGITNDDNVVVYDAHGIFSSPRLWWMFKVFGHNNVQVLNGGLPAWKSASFAVENGEPIKPHKTKFKAGFKQRLIALKNEVEKAVKNEEAVILDARSPARFVGTEPEPRKGLRSGSITGSKNLHFRTLISSEGKLLSPSELRQAFAEKGISNNVSVITTCGSGVTACILALGLEQAGYMNWKVYDGSWAEWGKA